MYLRLYLNPNKSAPHQYYHHRQRKFLFRMSGQLDRFSRLRMKYSLNTNKVSCASIGEHRSYIVFLGFSIGTNGKYDLVQFGGNAPQFTLNADEC